MIEFPTTYAMIQKRLLDYCPESYAHTRNFTSGNVSFLSPYLARGVITAPEVYAVLLKKHGKAQCAAFLKQLLWREYFQRKLQHLPQGNPVSGKTFTKSGLPAAMLKATTTIEAIDNGIKTLYDTGYMHNHLRLYAASLCFMAGSAPLLPEQWMYYHLLDGDMASNHFSWQWVGGLLTGKQYFANQQNINFFTGSNQSGSFLDKSYEELMLVKDINELSEATEIKFKTLLPEVKMPLLNPEVPVLLFNSYSMDPVWHLGENYQKVLLLDPSHFEQCPISEKVLAFILALADNITGIQIYTGNYESLKTEYPRTRFIAKEHPLFTYPGAVVEPREWLAPNVTGDFPSFSKYFKAVLKKHPEYAAT